VEKAVLAAGCAGTWAQTRRISCRTSCRCRSIIHRRHPRARFDGVRYGPREPANELSELYNLTRGRRFGPEVTRRIMIGTYALSAGYYDSYYGQAQRVRTLIRRDFETAFKEVDLIAAPTSPGTAFKISAHQTARWRCTGMCSHSSQAGIPAYQSMPVLTDNLPIFAAPGYYYRGPRCRRRRMPFSWYWLAHRAGAHAAP
jgi:Asp-tRNA(Asn)/Glu-tRNA(Gln) amidotransferase A subunit family amidase